MSLFYLFYLKASSPRALFPSCTLKRNAVLSDSIRPMGCRRVILWRSHLTLRGTMMPVVLRFSSSPNYRLRLHRWSCGNGASCIARRELRPPAILGRTTAGRLAARVLFVRCLCPTDSSSRSSSDVGQRERGELEQLRQFRQQLVGNTAIEEQPP